ncbi:MAG: hypothetical protein QXZ44_00495 [Ferroplasma sp.]
MDDNCLKNFIKIASFKKITGPPEDWLKAIYSMQWGFRDKPSLNTAYNSIGKNDLFIFHSMSIENLRNKIKVNTGIIGFGISSKKFIEKNDPYPGYEAPDLRPLRFSFSDMWFFGDVGSIKIEPIDNKIEKGESYIISDIYRLLENCLPFSTLKSNGISISTQGAIRNINPESAEKLSEIIYDKERFHISGSEIN